jgi:acyl-CoA dehydrogenase
LKNTLHHRHGLWQVTSELDWKLHWHRQIEDKFSPFAKETLAKLVDFARVSKIFSWIAFPFSLRRQNELEPARRVWQAQLPDDPVQRWKTVIPITEELKSKAKRLGLWNLFLSKTHYPEHGVPLTNLEVWTNSAHEFN